MTWWQWIILGCILMGVEIVTPSGFFLFFFGVGAVLVGSLTWAGALPELWHQLFAYSLLAIASTMLLLKKASANRAKVAPPQDLGNILGEIGTAKSPAGQGEMGQLELRGSSWSFRNIGNTEIKLGDRCKVIKLDGLTLHIERCA